MSDILDLFSTSFGANEHDPLVAGDDLSFSGARDAYDHALGAGELLLALDDGCSRSSTVVSSKQQLRTVLRAWLRRLDDDADSQNVPHYPLSTLTDALRGYGAHVGDADAGLDVINDEGKFLLVERHKGLSVDDRPYWFSRHASLRAAREYNANQDCAEDWSVESIIELRPE